MISPIAYINCNLCGGEMLNTETRYLPSRDYPETPLAVCRECHRRRTLNGRSEPAQDRSDLFESGLLSPTRQRVVASMATIREITAAVWHTDDKYAIDNARVTISHIRKKLAKVGSPWRIESSGSRPTVYTLTKDEALD
jgi:hypothetical protein